MRNKKIVIISLLFFLMINVVSAVIIENGTIINTSNSSITFSFSINVSNITIEPNSVQLYQVNFTNSTGFYSCNNINHTTPNSVLDSSKFNCTLESSVVENPSEENSLVESSTTVISGGGYPLYLVSENDLERGYSKLLKENWKIKFNLENKSYELKINKIYSESVEIIISDKPLNINIPVWEERFFDLNEDGYYDLKILISKINYKGKYSEIEIEIKKVNEKVKTGSEISSIKENWEEKGKFPIISIILGIFLIGLMLTRIIFRRIRFKKHFTTF